MLSRDISTSAALAHLHRRENDDAVSLDRRRFLQMVGMGIGAGLVAGPGSSILDHVIPGLDPSAWALGPVGPADGILLVIGMYGGNDGLNTVVPFNDGHYYSQRGGGAYPDMSVPGDQTLKLDGNYGLHPELTEFKRFWDAGQMAIVQGVGHGTEDFSHFASMAKWMSAQPTGVPTTGWVGRWLDGYLSGGTDLYAAAELGYTLPLHLIGSTRVGTTVPIARPDYGLSFTDDATVNAQILQTLRDLAVDDPTWLGSIGQVQLDQLQLASTLDPVIPETVPEKEIVAKLQIAARLINANLGMRVVTAGFGDFDSHAGQPDQHPVRLKELNDGLVEFFRVLDPAWHGQVTVMTFSEFGRTSYANAGLGTDHGSSAPQFVFGKNVKGGFYGERPSLAKLGRWERMDTPVDMRNYLGSVIDGWLGGGASDVLGAGFTENLGLFRSGPTGPTFANTKAGQFVGMTPVRIYDSRGAVGGRALALAPGETINLRIAGENGVPATGIRAVAVNISSIHPTSNSYITAYPSGFPRPGTATLNPRPGAVVPNMSIVGVGDDGTIQIYNNSGDVHITVDLMGYFTSDPAAKMLPLSPNRILDTRIGVGAPAARVAAGAPLVLDILGRGGVPGTGVDSVVLNVTSVGPSATGWLTAWPTGVAKPHVANLSYRQGEIIPNMIICKVGPDGRINLEASAGDLELVADVVGCYSASGAGMQPLAPARLLDTRTGAGAPQGPVGPGQEIVLSVGGSGGVPANASAAIINLTGIRASEQTFLTAYPDGETMPTAASLNPAAGMINGNLIIAKLGAGGRVRIYNDRGALDLTADVTGYFA